MYIWNEDKQRWETDTPASQVPIKDLAELYESDNVEGALAELAGERDKHDLLIKTHNEKIENMDETIEWLKINGGGGGGTGSGGSVMPTLTTTDELNQVVPKGQEIILNVFFSSPNLGNGSLILLVNNKEVGSYTLKQGSNTVNIGALEDLRNKVVVYAKDRAGLVSNELTYNIINGGISLSLDFDYYADYSVDADILMRYTVDTDQTNPKLEVKVDDNVDTVDCKTGYNEYYFRGLTVGVHKVTVRAYSGEYISETYSFSLVVINSESLYLSSSFGDNPQCTFGVPVVIPYRISYIDDTEVAINLYLNDTLNKTLTSKRGSFAWTLNDLETGAYTYKIECTLGEETVTVEGTFEVVQGDYTPIQINTSGLLYQMGCANRTNQDDDRQEFMYKDIKTTLHDFNFETNGWLNGTLVCNGGAYAEIDYPMFKDNVPYSTTVEIDFEATDIGITDARIIECKDASTNKGFYVALSEAKLNSISNEARVYITPEERTTVSLMVDRTTRFAKIFVNGICTSAFKLTDSGSGTSTVLESFQHNGKIFIGCDKDLGNIGNCVIHDIRIYNRALQDDDIVKNVIAQETDLVKQQELYNFCFDNNTLPVMRLYSDEVENRFDTMTESTAIRMRAIYRNTNSEKYGQPFELNYCKVYWQGTSSLDYIRKNFNIELYDDALQPFYYSPYPNGVEEYLFCLKCDYMESSHSRNVGIGKLANKYWYSTKNPAQLKNPNIRNAIEGFPMLLYINDEFMGVYNFNTDRYSNATFGYTDTENCLVYEVSANSDTTAGAFFLYDSEKHGGNELDYYKADFLSLFPPTRRAGNDDFAEIKELIRFTDTSSDEVFIESINNNLYFNKEYLLRYIIYALLMGAVDSLGKNMKLATWDKGRTWYPQLYDCDTTLGLDNTGFLKYINSNIKIEEGTYNTSNSRLWQRVIELFWAEIQVEYAKMRNTYLTLDHIYECIVEEQMDKIPATYYNQDTQTKYLQFGSSYLYALHGQGKQQIMTWLRERLLYIDTYLEYWSSTSDYVTIRASKLGEIYLDLETYDNMFLQVKWRNTGNADDVNAIQIKEMRKGEVTRFTFNSLVATDQEIRVYGGKYLKSIGALDNLAPTKVFITNAPRLTEIVCHSENLQTIDLSTCTNLQHIDLKDCTNLGLGDQSTKTIEASQCMNLKYVNCQNTQILGINLDTRGTNIEEIWYPKTVTAISLSNCMRLTTVGLEAGHSINELKLINCPNLESFGDREYVESLKKYKYSRCHTLNGVQSVMLDGSCLTFDALDFTENVGLENIEVKNMPNLEKIILGVNTISETFIEPTLTYLEGLRDLKIKSSNCNKLKEFIITCSYRKSYPALSTLGGRGYIKPYKPYDQFNINTLDLSEIGNVESVKLLCTCSIKNLILPTTVTEFICNSWFDMDLNSDFTSDIDAKVNHANYNYNLGTDSGYHWFKTWNYNKDIKNYLWITPTSISGSVIWNIWNKNTEQPSTNGVWDFKGVKLTDFVNYHVGFLVSKAYSQYPQMTTLGGYTYSITNLDLVAHNYLPRFDNRVVKSVTGEKLDYSNYIGDSFVYALTYINENEIQVTLPQDISNIEYWNYMLTGVTMPSLKWNDDIVMKYLVNITGSETKDMVLKEQTDYDTDGIVINNTRDNGGLWFQNSNIRYIKEFNMGARFNITNLLGGSQIERIGTIDVSNATGATEAIINSVCSSLNRVDLIKAPAKSSSSNLISGFQGLKLSYPLKITGSNLYGANLFRACNFKSLDLSECTFNGALQYGFSGTTIQEGSLVMKGTCTNLVWTFSLSVPTLDITELDISECISMERTFKDANIGNLLGLPTTIPNTVTSCSSMFENATITQATPNTIPTFLDSSECTSITNMCYSFQEGALQVPSVFSVPPKITGNMLNLFNGNITIPETFTFDCSRMEYLLNGGSINLTSKLNIKDFTFIAPPYTYYKTVGSENDYSLQAMFCGTGESALTNLRFDLSKFKGTMLGTYYFLGNTKVANLTIDNLDLNVMTGIFTPSSNPLFLTDFTVAKACNSRDVDLSRVRMAYEAYLKIVEEGLKLLDCANMVSSFDSEGSATIDPAPKVSIKVTMSDAVFAKMKECASTTDNNFSFQCKRVKTDGKYSGIYYQFGQDDTKKDWEIDTYEVDKVLTYEICVSKCASSKKAEAIATLNNAIKTGEFKVSLTTANDSPHTITFGSLTNYAGTTSLSTAQKETLTTKAVVKGWNVVFV